MTRASGQGDGPSPAPFALRTQDGARLVIANGRIGHRDDPVEITYQLGPGTLHPGFINAHDHLFLNHFPRLGSPPYRNAYRWGDDIHARSADEIRHYSALPRSEALLFGALKNLLGGVTTVIHHDPWDDVLNHGFPVRVPRIRVAHSLRFERDLAAALAGDDATRHRPLSMHLAEGVDDVALAEIEQARERGLLNNQLLAVHVVGVDGQGIAHLVAATVAIVWCPTSNEFLYRRSPPRELFEAGLDVLVGTDSLLTADGTMLAELRAARSLGVLDERRLADAVGRTAARRLGLPDPILAAGQPADLVLLRKPLREARPADVGLVMVNGIPRLGDATLAELFRDQRVPVEDLAVGGVPKLVTSPLATVADRVFRLSPACRRILDD